MRQHGYSWKTSIWTNVQVTNTPLTVCGKNSIFSLLSQLGNYLIQMRRILYRTHRWDLYYQKQKNLQKTIKIRYFVPVKCLWMTHPSDLSKTPSLHFHHPSRFTAAVNCNLLKDSVAKNTTKRLSFLSI